MCEEPQRADDCDRFLEWVHAHTVQIGGVYYCAMESLSREMTVGNVLVGRPRRPGKMIRQQLIPPHALHAHLVNITDHPITRIYTVVCIMDSIESIQRDA